MKQYEIAVEVKKTQKVVFRKRSSESDDKPWDWCVHGSTGQESDGYFATLEEAIADAEENA